MSTPLYIDLMMIAAVLVALPFTLNRRGLEDFLLLSADSHTVLGSWPESMSTWFAQRELRNYGQCNDSLQTANTQEDWTSSDPRSGEYWPEIRLVPDDEN